MPSMSPSQLDRLNEIAWRLCPHTFGQHASNGRWTPYGYQRFIGELIASRVARGNGRLIIEAPPRHGKSELISKWTPTWFLDNLPHKKVILCSYGAELAQNFGRQVRNEFSQNTHLMTKLRDDSTAANRWNTEEGGGMLAVGVSGPVIGFGGDLIIIDDPHKNWEEAHSYTVRQSCIDWFGGTLYSRLEPNATIVIAMQRLHPDDLAGWLIENHPDPWEVVRLPAIAEAGDAMGRQPGDPLCPERYDTEALGRIRNGLATAGAWEAMYQQDPQSGGTGRLYSGFSEENIDKSLVLRNELPLQIAFDFNRNPGMHVILGQHDPAADLLTAVHEIHGPYMKLAPALDAIENLVKGLGGFRWREVHIFGDATGTQNRAETTMTCYEMILDWLKRMRWPYRMKVPGRNPPVLSRIETFNAALRDVSGDIHYRLHPRCSRLLADLREMKEDEQGMEDKRDEKLSHASSAEGYRVHWLRPVRRLVSSGGSIGFAG